MKKSKIIPIMSFFIMCFFVMDAWGGISKGKLAGKLNINTATANEFTMLPGIGPKKAKDIVQLRTDIKGFKHTDDLLKVRGLGVKLYKSISAYIKLGGKSDLKKVKI